MVEVTWTYAEWSTPDGESAGGYFQADTDQVLELIEQLKGSEITIKQASEFPEATTQQ